MKREDIIHFWTVTVPKKLDEFNEILLMPIYFIDFVFSSFILGVLAVCDWFKAPAVPPYTVPIVPIHPDIVSLSSDANSDDEDNEITSALKPKVKKR